MQMKCCVCEAVVLVVCIGQLLHINRPLLVNGEIWSDKKPQRNAIQSDTDLQRNSLLYRDQKLNSTQTTNSTTEIVLHHNRNSRSIKTHQRRKVKNATIKKSKCKNECMAKNLEMKLDSAMNSYGNIGNKIVDKLASLNWLTEAMQHKTGNRMAGSSQIGDREYHTVIKPTVVVNYHGAIEYARNEGKLAKSRNTNRKLESGGQNVIQINQEINLETPHGLIRVDGLGMKNKLKHDFKKYLPNENYNLINI